jgi:hypothetical protein
MLIQKNLTQCEATEAKWVWKQDSSSSSDIREGNKENSITFGDIIGASVKFQKVGSNFSLIEEVGHKVHVI